MKPPQKKETKNKKSEKKKKKGKKQRAVSMPPFPRFLCRRFREDYLEPRWLARDVARTDAHGKLDSLLLGKVD